MLKRSCSICCAQPGIVQTSFAVGRGPVNPAEQGYGNGILKLPLDLSKVEDYFIPANGVFLDNVRRCTLSQLLLCS